MDTRQNRSVGVRWIPLVKKPTHLGEMSKWHFPVIFPFQGGFFGQFIRHDIKLLIATEN